jgi:hypothetical protein
MLFCLSGSTMFASISNLLKFLKKSFQIENKSGRRSSNYQDEQQFQIAVINGISKRLEKSSDPMAHRAGLVI